MKKIAFLFLLFSYQCFAQKEANIWYFGAQAGIDFNSGSPVALTDCSASFTAFEGVGTLSDANGNLLFYTDGNTVFDANHMAMPNGTGLFSDVSSTQTGLSMKQPGNDSIYYIFHIGLFPITLYYSTVDMSMNGGLGDVVQKNVLLRNNTTEKVTAVNDANGTDIWIISHDSNSDKFAAFLLSSSGLSSLPVISSTGQLYTSDIGYLKASPDGTRLASADFYMNSYSLYDFDNSTGIVSNPFFSPANYQYAYGCEWSPDGTKLYGGAELTNKLWQFDVSAGANVWNTSVVIYQTASTEFEALQLGPDGKIYCSRYLTDYLGVINDPDSLGAACNYVDDGVYLQGRVCYLGLPNYNMSNFSSSLQTSFASSDTSVCEKFCIDFFDSTLNGPVSWQWYFPGASPSSSTEQNPTHICYDDPGVYDVTLVTTNSGGTTDSVTYVNYITVNQNPFAPVITQTWNILTSSAASSYQWYLNGNIIPGATDQSYEIMEDGLYTVVVTNETGCESQSSFNAVLSGVEDVNENFSAAIYPNPSNGNFVLELSGTENIGDVYIDVVNALGQKVFSSEEIISSNHKLEFSLNGIAAGVYIIEMRSDDFFLMKKITVK